ncbi:hypothetical protein EV182_003040 [Spiromyces aspiralis]|uniref:Uncharacterized protein n=1 Tax=Spiromyces aspiralis TaxID=68401 RepID=A0ACC1HHG8_9FUNG|nr:hypothetical protein EV182_003040 [Spiromyces aspiralis]
MLLEESILPRVRKAIVDWNPRLLKPSTVINPGSSSREAIEDAIASPRFQGSNIPPHLWIHPWLPYLGEHLVELYTGLRHKLATSLAEWEPGVGGNASPDFGLSIVQPWQYVFDRRDFGKLLKRAVTPKLDDMMRHRFVVNAQNQDVTPVRVLLAWSRLLPRSECLRLLERGFFQPWLEYLSRWLRQAVTTTTTTTATEGGSQFSQIAQWYSAWKSIFPTEVLEDSNVQDQFRRALAMMQYSIRMTAASKFRAAAV